ncbi:MAG: class I SAM-dependent methyltransferase [Bacteroidetes bacterium]|nr:class I SAM-dependent methyltransferase [Bacteroidota bacterium]
MQCEICNQEKFHDLPFFYLWNNKKFQLVQCNNCKLITLDPKPTSQELELLYAEDYFDHGAHGLDAYQKTYEEIRDEIPVETWKEKVRETILKEKPDAKSLFEIGAAMGYFLNAAKELGMHVSGLEISSSANKRAKEKFNLDLYSGDYEEMDLTNEYGKWDVVYGGDVFEHFSNPSIVLDKIYNMLKPGGIAYLVIPSTFNLFSSSIANTFLKLSGKQQKMADNPYHLFEYTSKTASKMLKTKFKKIKIINNIKKPSEVNLKSGNLLYKIKYVIHLFNYPYTKITGRRGDRVTLIGIKE